MLFLGERNRKVLSSQTNHGKMLTVRDGFLVCPTCKRNRQVMRIPSYTTGARVIAYCRSCKTEHEIDIDEGRCYMSQSQ